MSYEYTPNKERSGPWLAKNHRQCLCVYVYFMDREFGLIYGRLQTWLRMDLQVGFNAGEFPARRLERAGIGYEKRDNCFTRIDNIARVQKMLDALLTRKWLRLLSRLAGQINPHLGRGELLADASYDWTFRETETATDVMFRDAASLAAIYPSLVRHATEQFGCRDVLRFLARRTNKRFSDDPTTDRKEWIEGVRVKHRVEENSIKMYDKQGSVLRVETTIVDPKRFRVLRRVTREGESALAWVLLRKGIMDSSRRPEIGRAANERYLQALRVVGAPAPTRQLFDRVTDFGQRVMSTALHLRNLDVALIET